MSVTFYRLPKVRELTGFSTSTIWRLEKAGEFPSRIKIGQRAVAWLDSEVNEWLNKKSNLKTEIKFSQSDEVEKNDG